MGLKESLIERVSGGEFKKKEEARQEQTIQEEEFSGGLDLSSALETPVSSEGFSMDSLVDSGSYDEDGLEVSQDFNPLMQAANEAKHEDYYSSHTGGQSQQPVSIDQLYQQQLGQSVPTQMTDRYSQQYVDPMPQNRQQHPDTMDMQQDMYQQDMYQQDMYQQQDQGMYQQSYNTHQQQDMYQQQGYFEQQSQAGMQMTMQSSYDYQQNSTPQQQYGMQDYAPQYNQVVPEPAPVSYGMSDTSSNSYSSDSSVNSILEENLLALAKKVVLEDIVKTFESALITKDALSKLIDSYLNNSQSPYTNGKAVLTSVIDEIMASDYEESHYGELVPMILSSVKADLN